MVEVEATSELFKEVEPFVVFLGVVVTIIAFSYLVLSTAQFTNMLVSEGASKLFNGILESGFVSLFFLFFGLVFSIARFFIVNFFENYWGLKSFIIPLELFKAVSLFCAIVVFLLPFFNTLQYSPISPPFFGGLFIVTVIVFYCMCKWKKTKKTLFPKTRRRKRAFNQRNAKKSKKG